MTVSIIQGDALSLPIESGTVQLVITSPPYFKLRGYEDGGEVITGQVGQEHSIEGYILNLCEATREMFRVLAPNGSAWINLGDSYGTNGGLLGTPWRYALAVRNMLGLSIRQEVIWEKPNSFIDARSRGRFRRSHETWFHLTRGMDYTESMETLREQPTARYEDRPQYRRANELFAAAGLTDDHRAAVRAVGIIDSAGGEVRSGGSWDSAQGKLAAEVRTALGSYYRELCGNGAKPKGSMPSSVQRVPAYPLRVPSSLGVGGHFASFPLEWPMKLIAGYSTEGDTILDPFGGTGTTALAAATLGRHGISVDLSADYCEVARWRTADPKQRARATKLANEQRRTSCAVCGQETANPECRICRGLTGDWKTNY